MGKFITLKRKNFSGYLKKVLDNYANVCYTIGTKRKGEIQMEKFDKRMNKMDAETLQQFLAFRKRANAVPSKKGKGSYNRNNFKKGRDVA